MSLLRRLFTSRLAQPAAATCDGCGEVMAQWVALLWRDELVVRGAVTVMDSDAWFTLCPPCAGVARADLRAAVRGVVQRHRTLGKDPR